MQHFDFMSLVPNCQHGGKVGFCDECVKEKPVADIPRWKVMEEEFQKREEAERERERREHPERVMAEYIPKKFLSKSLESFAGSDPVKNLCIEYANGFIREKMCREGKPIIDKGLAGYPGSLLFSGKTGCGKTHLAVAIVRELVKRNAVYRVRFITAPEFLLEIRATFKSGDGVTESDILDKYSKCELLILDDLGAEKVSDFTIQSLYLVIDRRNRDLRPTIVTTNLTLEEIETQIDARMASRLADMKVVKLTMPDYRKKR